MGAAFRAGPLALAAGGAPLAAAIVASSGSAVAGRTPCAGALVGWVRAAGAA